MASTPGPGPNVTAPLQGWHKVDFGLGVIVMPRHRYYKPFPKEIQFSACRNSYRCQRVATKPRRDEVSIWTIVEVFARLPNSQHSV